MTDHQQAGELMGLVRQHLYIGGRAPDGYNDGRDFRMLRDWLRAGVEYDDLADMIRGLGKLRDDGELGYIEPGDGLTLRIVAAKEDRYGRRHLAKVAREYWRDYKAKEYRPKHGMERFRISFDGEAA